MEYKYYGHFTTKEKHIFKELIFHSSMIYNKVNWYFLNHKFDAKMQPNIVRYLCNHDEDGKYFSQRQCGEIVENLINNWVAFFEAHKEWKKNPRRFTGKPKRPRCHKTSEKMNSIVFGIKTISGLDGVKNGRNGKGVIRNNKIYLSLSKKSKIKFKAEWLEVNLFNFKFPIGLEKSLINLQQIRLSYDKKQKRYYLAFVYRAKKNNLAVDSFDTMAIDFGQNNFATVVFDYSKDRYILDGKELKSKIAYINGKISKYQSKEMKKLKGDNKKYKNSKRINELYKYWNNFSFTYTHKVSRKIINLALDHKCKTIVIGDFKGVKFRKKHMKYFLTMPHTTLLRQIKYKAKMSGIEVRMQNEAYTSGCSCIDDYKISKECYNKKRRKKRGDFVTNNGFHINADVNGAYNILRRNLNNIPHCLEEKIAINIYITYLNLLLLSSGFKGNSALMSGNVKKPIYIFSPVLIHL